MNAWLPQATQLCGDISDTSSCKFLRPKGSLGHAFTVSIRTENQSLARGGRMAAALTFFIHSFYSVDIKPNATQRPTARNSQNGSKIAY